MLLTHPKRSILLFSVGCDQKIGEQDDAIEQVNTFFKDRLRKEHPVALWNCLGSLLGLTIDSLDNRGASSRVLAAPFYTAGFVSNE